MALSATATSSSIHPHLSSILPRSPLLSSLNLSSSHSLQSSSSSCSPSSSLKLSQGVRPLRSSRNPNPKVKASCFDLHPYLFRVSISLVSNCVLDLQGLRVNCSVRRPLRVMISGAPASGKGTQCQMIVEKVSAFFSLRFLLFFTPLNAYIYAVMIIYFFRLVIHCA